MLRERGWGDMQMQKKKKKKNKHEPNNTPCENNELSLSLKGEISTYSFTKGRQLQERWEAFSGGTKHAQPFK